MDSEQQKDLKVRLTVEMSNARSNMVKFANRDQANQHNSAMQSYYAGMRDGLLRALDLTDRAEDNS
jgi:hypothetical protein